MYWLAILNNQLRQISFMMHDHVENFHVVGSLSEEKLPADHFWGLRINQINNSKSCSTTFQEFISSVYNLIHYL